MKASESTILDEIVAHKRLEIESLKRTTPMHELKSLSSVMAPLRGFGAALANKQPAVIAEIKKASPSKGVIRDVFEPREIAQSYAKHGAACMSVLTDERFFQGSTAALRDARNATHLPVLRKDFIVDEYQIYETRILPADCLLLILAILDAEELRGFYDLAVAVGLDVVVEVHNEVELDRALALDAQIIGINNRNLKTFETDLANTERLAAKIPSSTLVVSESGIHSRGDVERLRACGVHTYLVGEAFMKAPDPGAAMAEIFKPPAPTPARQAGLNTHAS
ncbi:MAG: indole-3-glycerol phosphate synthase TrpC [Gammaproteobacteria bacterium]|nr:indole-3-glycerol phosphate synthase TrpC [Gammaproteobacteria bacterium]